MHLRIGSFGFTAVLVGLTVSWIVQRLHGLEPSSLQIQRVRLSHRGDVSRVGDGTFWVSIGSDPSFFVRC